MRLTFVCTSATTFPTVIVRTASSQRAPSQAACSCAPVPFACAAGATGKARRKTRMKAANPAAFGPAAMKAVTGVGAPSYTSGVQTWKGADAILKPKPIINIAAPANRSGGYKQAVRGRAEGAAL